MAAIPRKLEVADVVVNMKIPHKSMTMSSLRRIEYDQVLLL